MKYPKSLTKKSTIGLIAPAGPLRNIKIEEISGSKDISINIDKITTIQFLSLYKPGNVFSFNSGYNRVFTCNTKLKTEKISDIYNFKENNLLKDNDKFTWTNGKIFHENTSYAIHLMRINQYEKYKNV